MQNPGRLAERAAGCGETRRPRAHSGGACGGQSGSQREQSAPRRPPRWTRPSPSAVQPPALGVPAPGASSEDLQDREVAGIPPSDRAQASALPCARLLAFDSALHSGRDASLAQTVASLPPRPPSQLTEDPGRDESQGDPEQARGAHAPRQPPGGTRSETRASGSSARAGLEPEAAASEGRWVLI